MENKIIGRNADPDTTALAKITEWLAQAGITVESSVEDEPDRCSVCSPPQLHVAA